MNKQNINRIINFLNEAGNLKNTYRYGSFKVMNSESAADHSWRLSLMVITLVKELNLKINVEKALKLAIVHDIAESITGDIPAPDIASGKVSQKFKEQNETKAINKYKKSLPGKVGNELYRLWQEYNSAKTEEAKFIKALDKLESFANIIEVGKKIGAKAFNYTDYIATYPDKYVKNYPKLKPVLRALKTNLKKEYSLAKIPWKKEYDQY